MAVAYPSNLRAPLHQITKEQSRLIRESQPLSGPAYTELLSDDAPVFYNLTFAFISLGEALQFRAWIENNGIHKGVEFDCPIKTEATEAAPEDAKKTQTVKLVDGDIRSYTRDQSSKHFIYQGVFRARKEVTGLEAYYPIIEEGGSYLLNGREQLDRAVNLYAPEA